MANWFRRQVEQAAEDVRQLPDYVRRNRGMSEKSTPETVQALCEQLRAIVAEVQRTAPETEER